MTTPNQQIRTCLACGEKKPLSVFLQISGTKGTVYGNICAACRSQEAKGKKSSQPVEDDDSSGNSGLRVDSKNKNYSEIKQKESYQEIKEAHKEYVEERDKITLEKEEHKVSKANAEKDHRFNYLETKKKQSLGFLSSEPANPFQAHKDKAQEIKLLERAIEQENQNLRADTNQFYLDPQFSQLKFQTDIFKSFKAALGTGANFRTTERLYQHKSETKEKTAQAKEPLLDYIDKTWGPNSTRRR